MTHQKFLENYCLKKTAANAFDGYPDTKAVKQVTDSIERSIQAMRCSELGTILVKVLSFYDKSGISKSLLSMVCELITAHSRHKNRVSQLKLHVPKKSCKLHI